MKSGRFIWEAEISIDRRNLDRYGDKAYQLRNDAHFKKAKEVLSIIGKEFSRLNLPRRRYRQIMEEEIEGASNSLELSDFQRRLLETLFFFPEEQPSPIVAATDSQGQDRRRRGSGRPKSEASQEQLKRWALIRRIKKSKPELKGRPFWQRVQFEGGMPEVRWKYKTLLQVYDDPKSRNKLEKDITAAIKQGNGSS